MALFLFSVIAWGQTIALTDNGDGTWTLASMPAYNVALEVEYEDEAPVAPIDLIDNGDGTWTLASMPAYNVALEVEYEDEAPVAPIDLIDNGDGTWTLASMPGYNVALEVEYEDILVTYTVRYVDTEGNELKEARTGEGPLGGTATLTYRDKEPIYSQDKTKKYAYLSDNSGEVTLTENVAENVITVTFNGLDALYATVNCMANGTYERLAQYNETFFEDEDFATYPPVGLRGSDGKYYFTTPTMNNIKTCPFPANITPVVRGGKTYYSLIVLYNEDASVAYYQELENLGIAKNDDRFGIVGLGQFETLAEGNMTSPIDIDREYFSQGIGIGLFPESYVWTEPIAEAGTYRVSIYGKNADDRNTYPFSLGYRMANGDVYLYSELSVPAWPYAEEASLHVIDGVSIPAGTSLVLMNELSEEEYDGYNIQLDNIKLVRTGDYVELPVGINEMKNEELRMKNEGAAIYNLAGQRLGKMQKGINIVGGRKLLK